MSDEEILFHPCFNPYSNPYFLRGSVNYSFAFSRWRLVIVTSVAQAPEGYQPISSCPTEFDVNGSAHHCTTRVPRFIRTRWKDTLES